MNRGKMRFGSRRLRRHFEEMRIWKRVSHQLCDGERVNGILPVADDEGGNSEVCRVLLRNAGSIRSDVAQHVGEG
ncbi:hypothetical protein AJ87_40385 [Rhizobium yanglingense]|nr:hypothetical protein AJ87_40385 [Rhizobium yanglingense]